MSTIRCPHCGTANRAGSNYCNHCGATLHDEESPQSHTDLITPPVGTTPKPAHQPTPEWTQEQPWLRPEPPAPEESVPPSPQAAEAEAAILPSRRLVGSVQGLLDPLRLFSTDDLADTAEIRSLPLPLPLPVDGEQMRRLRTLLTTVPTLEELGISVQFHRLPNLRIPWLFWLLGLAVSLPILLKLPGPAGTPRLWPGVTEAYTAIQDLPAGASVLLLWAYDPATASELDLLAEPLMIHLLERQLQPIVVTMLPNGPATARRLFQQARTRWFASQNIQVRPTDAPQLEVHYLTGPAAFPLLGQNLGVALTGQLTPPRFSALRRALPRPQLTIAVVASADPLRQGIEQLQPLSETPLIAFVGAGADPILRPYWESGQLRGLVSGFDGAYAYQALRAQAGSTAVGADLSQQVVAQNWGHLALLLIMLLGNLASLLGRGSSE